MKHEARVWKQLILNLKARDNFEYPAVGTISFLSVAMVNLPVQSIRKFVEYYSFYKSLQFDEYAQSV